MAKGQKTCDDCGLATGPRTKVCKGCNTAFVFKAPNKRRPKTNLIEDWQALQKGQVIKSLQGYGPYYVNDEEERVSTGYSGLYKVDYVDGNGIGAYEFSSDGNGSGFCHLYMGEEKKSKVFGTLSPHKIHIVKNVNAILGQEEWEN